MPTFDSVLKLYFLICTYVYPCGGILSSPHEILEQIKLRNIMRRVCMKSVSCKNLIMHKKSLYFIFVYIRLYLYSHCECPERKSGT